MKICYKKDLSHNYLLIEKKNEYIEEEYCIKMIQNQEIEGILSLERRTIDMKQYLYYDITRKQSLSLLWEDEVFSREKIRLLLKDIVKTIERGADYLLCENDFILNPEIIYLEVSSNSVSLVYLSGYNKDIKKQMLEFIEYIMNRVDYKDNEAVLLVYALYAICKGDDFMFKDLLDKLDEGITLGKVEQPKERVKHIEIVKDHFKEPEIQETNKKAEIGVININYLYSAASAFAGIIVIYIAFSLKLVHNSLGNRIEAGKVFFLLLIIVLAEAYSFKVIWDKKRSARKVQEREEYLDFINNKDEVIIEELANEGIICQETIYDEGYDEDNPTTFLGKMELEFVLESLEREGDLIIIEKSPFTIGKLKGKTDHYLSVEGVSRYHLRIEKENERMFIMDLNSTNGTKINGVDLQPYEKTQLQIDDLITIGNIKYRFLIKSPF